MTISQVDDGPPPWLPGWMEGLWVILTDHPFVLASLIVVPGATVAILARAFILFWGLKVVQRTTTELDERLLRLGAGVAALVLLYISLMSAVQVLPFGEWTRSVLTRLVVSFLVLQLMRVGLQASSIVLAFLSHVRNRYSIV